MNDLNGYTVEIVKKAIKHIYFRVYPDKKKIIVSAPAALDNKTLNYAILSKKAWLKKQAVKPRRQTQYLQKKYITGETIWFKGKNYTLVVKYQNSRSKVSVAPDNHIQLIVKPDTNTISRGKVLSKWFRQELLHAVKTYVSKWQPILGVTVKECRIRKMHTRWGSCNIKAKRIWLNLSLIQFPESILEYVIVHEMVHLIEPDHNTRFNALMDKYIPDWRILKKELNP